MSRKKTILQQLKASIGEAKAENDELLQDELQQIISAIQQPWNKELRVLSTLLQKASSHVTKHYIAEIFGKAKDSKVLKPLMRAALAPENENYNSVYFWNCSEYDCTAHINFFVKFLLESEDPGESMVACITVIEEMQGPFDSEVITKIIPKLLRCNRSHLDVELQKQDELFTIQAAYALLDKYFSQVDAIWKDEHPVFENSIQIVNVAREKLRLRSK
jgi:hypothetical protein